MQTISRVCSRIFQTSEREMPRGPWKGAISFGLVNVPVELLPAERRSSELDLTMLDRRDLAPVGRRRAPQAAPR